jgi:hypothetical protein
LATKTAQWIEDLDDLINRVSDLYISEPVRDDITSRLEQILEDIQEEVILRDTGWKN